MYQLIENILSNQTWLWGVYIIMMLLGFVFLTRFLVFIKTSYTSANKEIGLFKTLNFPKKITSFFVAENEVKLFPNFYEKFVIVFSPKYWKIFQILFFLFILLFLVGFVLGKISLLFVSVMIFLVGGFVIFVSSQAQKIRRNLVEQFPLFLQGMARSMQAGYSFENALAFVRTEVSDPLESELLNIESQINLQIPLFQVLENFAKRVDHEEVYFFTESTIIQLKTGGNLVELFQKIGRIINEKLKLERDIRSYTSQGKMSGLLIAGLWPGSLLLFWWISPEHVEVLFTTSLGQILLSVAILLEAIGFYFIWKIVSIRI